jgi:hypothetical protein
VPKHHWPDRGKHSFKVTTVPLRRTFAKSDRLDFHAEEVEGPLTSAGWDGTGPTLADATLPGAGYPIRQLDDFSAEVVPSSVVG